MLKRTLSFLLTACLATGASATEPLYPIRPVSIVVTTAAGGSVDAIARAIAMDLSKSMGQPVVVENKPGANGNIAADYVKRSAADGHTLLMLSSSTFTLNPFILERVPFKPLTDFTPVAMTAGLNMVLVVNPALGVSTMDELITLLKRNPGKYNYGSSGNGSLPHVATELLSLQTGVRATHVPYKGIAPALNDLLAGQIHFMFDSGTAMSHIEAGKLKALAVIGPNRLGIFPEVPTMAQSGIIGMETASGWHGIFAPHGTPDAVVAQLNTEINKILQSPTMRERMKIMGFESVAVSAQSLGETLKRDMAQLEPLIKKIDIANR